MTIKIDGIVFEGPYKKTDSIENKSGVYVVLCGEILQGIIDVGEAAKVKNRLDTHDRKECWTKNCNYNIVFAVHYTPNLQQSGRKEIEKKIRDNHSEIPCGEE